MKPSKTTPVKETEEEKPIVVVPPKKKNMLPVRFTTTDLTVDLIYMENTALITEIKFSGGIRYLMTYADKVLKKLQKYKDNVHVQSVDYLITDGRITRVTRLEVREKVTTPAEKYYLEYNASFQINNIKTYAANNSLLSDNTLEYKVDGNLLSSAIATGSLISSYTYSYDIRNGIFQSVLFCQLLKMEINEVFFTPGTNNILNLFNSRSQKENVDYEYTYTTDDFPTEIKIRQKGLLQTYKVTYTELK
ncbi:MAG: hypothetical protein H7223_04895 [Pedobacter sp.]|nr:hypothetical protein [Pedobacter sp.]